jgi:hypothetical protein
MVNKIYGMPKKNKKFMAINQTLAYNWIMTSNTFFLNNDKLYGTWVLIQLQITILLHRISSLEFEFKTS